MFILKKRKEFFVYPNYVNRALASLLLKLWI